MLIAIAGTRPSRLVVVAYDMGCPRRARGVRGRLDTVNHAKQYSVYETLLSQRETRTLLTELSDGCDASEDLLAAWWPIDGLRLEWFRGRLTVAGQAGGCCRKPAQLRANIGNFILCYDVSEPAALRAVAAEVGAECAMVQRSVYWLRASVARLEALLGRCATYLDAATDRLWAYPLGASRSIWKLGGASQSVLPIATHHW